MFKDGSDDWRRTKLTLKIDPAAQMPYVYTLVDFFQFDEFMGAGSLAYDWCLEHFGPSQPDTWEIHGDFVFIAHHHQAVEFKIRWF